MKLPLRMAALVALAASALALGVPPAAAQSQQQIDWCVNAAREFSPDQQISGCTAAIQSGRWNGRGLVWAFNNRGGAYYFKGELEPAFADFEQAIRLNPQDAVAFNNRGLVYQAKGEIDRAIADYSEAIRLDPAYAFAFNNRGGAYLDKGDDDRAIADYSEAIRLEPKFSVALDARANLFAVRREFDRAIADYDQLIELNPKDAAAFNNRGFMYYRKGDLDRALANFNEAIRLNPGYVLAFNNRGLVHHAKGDAARAIVDFDEAIRLDPSVPGHYLNRGLAYLLLGSLPRALADFSRASELDPRHPYLVLWQDIAARRSNMPSRLAQAMMQIDMTRWPAPVVRLYLGQITPAAVLAAADHPDAAIKNAQTCEAQFFAGELALLAGSKDEATRRFRLAAAACGQNTHPWVQANAELKALGAQP